MFRAAFPTASEQEEKRETAWVKENYDLSGNNGSSKEHDIVRLAGIWVSPEVAIELGDAYSLGNIIPVVAKAQPDPTANYRRSGKAAGNTPKGPPSTSASPAAKPLSTQSSTAALPNPSKRRKESSPAPASVPTPPPAPSATPVAAPPPRRSTRTKSPAPKPGPASLTAAVKTMKSVKVVRREEVLTPGSSDETAVGDDVEAADASADMETADIAGPDLRAQDIAEQQAMIEGLKAQRDAFMSDMGDEDGDGDGVTKLKRAREDAEEALVFDFKEPEVGERAIATNRRVGRFQLEPRQKSFAWGVAAFAVGLGAM